MTTGAVRCLDESMDGSELRSGPAIPPAVAVDRPDTLHSARC
jgi:hypothetical protein